MRIAEHGDLPGQRRLPPCRGQLARPPRRGHQRHRQAAHGHRPDRLGRGLRRRRRRLDRRRTAGDAPVRARPQTRGTARPSPATSTAPGCGTIASRPATSPSPASTWRSGTCAGRIAASRCIVCSAGRCGTSSTISTTWRRARRTSCAPSAPTVSSAAIAASISRSASMPWPRRRCWRPCGRRSARAPDPDRRQRGLVGARRRPGCSSAGTPGSASTSPRRRCRSSRSTGCAICARRTAVALCANEGLGSAAEAYQVIASGVADVVCFSSYWVGTLRRFHTLASLAGLLGIGVCKHTHGELGIAAAAAHQLMLTLPNAVPGCAADGRDHGRRPARDAAADRHGSVLGACRTAPGLGVEVDEARLRTLCRRLPPSRPVPALRRLRRARCARP